MAASPDDKRAQLAQLLRDRAQATRTAPLSYAQQRMWFLEQFEPGNVSYNICWGFRLSGRLDPEALRRAFAAVVRRHEILRTTFEAHDGIPRQRIHPPPEWSLPVVQLSTAAGPPPQEREATAQRLLTEAMAQPFAIERGPLLRTTLLQLAELEHMLIISMHHIVSDGWSLGIFLQEVATHYVASPSSENLRRSKLPIQYADYAAWQRQWLSEEQIAPQLAYWQQRLAGLPPIELPLDRPRPAMVSSRGVSIPIEFAAELIEALKRLALREGATLFMVLLAAFHALLRCWSGQDDLAVGIPIAGRTRKELEGLIGLFVNTLLIRADLSGDPTFRALLAQVKATTLEAYAHQEIPCEKLVEAQRLEPDLAGQPLIRVMFVLQNVPFPKTLVPGLTMQAFPAERATAMFELTLALREEGERLYGAWEYATDLFDQETIERLRERFQAILATIARAPETRVSEMPILTPWEESRLAAWNDTATPTPGAVCIHELFEEQVDRTPDAVAAQCEEAMVTYRDLDRRANRLAHRLRALGVGPEARVGLCLEPSIELLVALLGVLKAGAAYVPLEPTYPRERLDYLLGDSGSKVIVTDQALSARLPSAGVQRLLVDAPTERCPSQWEERLVGGARASNLAYVIYTSGSTGQPKGVLTPHRAVVNHIVAITQRFDLRKTDRVLQFAALSFDVAAEEIYPTLACGATLVLRSSLDAELTPQTFTRWVERQQLTVLNLPTAFWHAWTRAMEQAATPLPECIRLLIVGNEKVSAQVYGQWGRLAGPKPRWFNAYGPTEATITATCYEGQPGAAGPGNGAVPIGRPIANVRAYVLDANQRPVPIGTPGELYIGGAGLAHGYLNQPDLTVKHFLPDPLSPTPGARRYRTGDLARWLPDGNLEFLGRIDHQIKLRGYRIEPGEIEAVLARHPGVREALVVAREEFPETKRLVAYFLPGPETPSPEALREHLARVLPAHMVPSAFVSLSAWPLTPQGKVARRQLPAPDASATGAAQLMPRDDLEKHLAALWEELLSLRGIGVRQNFFELGGHSLLAAQLIFRVRDALALELPLRVLFETPTIEAMAVAIRAMGSGAAVSQSGAAQVRFGADSQLDSTIHFPPAVPYPAAPLATFLTGATGFLGAFLLDELLRQSTAKIYCLVRAADPTQGSQRLRSHLAKYQLWRPEYETRIVAVPGDLTQPRLGVPAETYSLLTARIELVYHCGALIKTTYPYAELRAANVGGTQEVLRLVGRTRTGVLHHISTLSVLDSLRQVDEPAVLETERPAEPERLPLGYSQSKSVAERLVESARALGARIAIYRPGWISGHAQTGVREPDDFLWRLLKGCAQAGCAPALEIALNLAPVDYIAKSIVAVSAQEDSIGRTFHLVNPRSTPLSRIFACLRGAGLPLETLPFTQWRAAILADQARCGDNAAFPLMPLFLASGLDARPFGARYDCTNTRALLAHSGIDCPEVDEALLNLYISYFIRTGFLPREPRRHPPGIGPAAL